MSTREKSLERTEEGASPSRLRVAVRLLGAAAVLAIPSLLRGQLVSDEVPRDRTVTAQEQLDEDLKDSRFHLGPMRLLPGFEVNNAGYNSNVFGSQFNPVGDWTATARSGDEGHHPVQLEDLLRRGRLSDVHLVRQLLEPRHLGRTREGLHRRLLQPPVLRVRRQRLPGHRGADAGAAATHAREDGRCLRARRDRSDAQARPLPRRRGGARAPDAGESGLARRRQRRAQ